MKTTNHEENTMSNMNISTKEWPRWTARFPSEAGVHDTSQRTVRADPEDPIAALRLITERLRLGLVTNERVKAAAECGHPAASVLFPVDRTEDLQGMDLLTTFEQRLFACDCAERVLPIFERERPGDKRPREAIETARRFARGEASERELSVAEEAAWDAWDGSWAAAGSAAWAAAHGAVAWSAAGSAVRASARDAVGASARDAARAAEIYWQRLRLAAYLLGEIDESPNA